MLLTHERVEDEPGLRVTPLRLPLAYPSVAPLVIAGDVALIILASVVSGTGYHLARFGSTGDFSEFVGLAAIVAAIFIPALKIRGAYQTTGLLDFRRQATHLITAWGCCFVFLFGIAFAMKLGALFSRGAVASFILLGLSFLLLSRLTWRRLIDTGIATGRLATRKVALVTEGGMEEASSFARQLERHGLRVTQYLLLPDLPRCCDNKLHTVISDVLSALRGSDVEEVLVRAEWHHSHRLLELVQQMRVLPFPMRFVPDALTAALIKRPWQEIGAAVAVEVKRPPLSPVERMTKRGLDILIAGAGLLFLCPLMLLTSLAIWLESPGPVLFRQRRRGFNGREFRILKFRTMSVSEDGPVVQQARRGDQRVTRCGYWLRRTSIDELPQLLNVLCGTMSIVGPRPHAVAHDEHYQRLIGSYALRHYVKPGLTGWAQVNGCRGETPTLESMAQRIEYDIWYAENYSIWLDLRIVLLTFREIFMPPNAY